MDPRLPETPVQWLVAAWGVLGVSAFLINPVIRLSGTAAEAFASELTAVHYAALVGWCVFMVYAEGIRGFHRQFSPRVVVRSLGIARADALLPRLLAPIAAMGLFYATRKRKIVSGALLVGIVAIVLVVRLLPQPWRGIVDAGVVLGLGIGVVSIAWHTVRTLAGAPPAVASDLP